MSQGDGKVFAYVKLFRHPPGSSTWHEDLNSYKHVAEDDIELYRVVRDLDQNGVQKGKVIEISAIWRPIQLVPVFGHQCPLHWTANTAVELATQFYVNSFMDKPTYYSVI